MNKKVGLQNILSRINNQRIFLRADFNVPLSNGKIKDATRIKATLPTIKAILEQNPKGLFLSSHLGRPNGQKKTEFSLKPVAEELEKLGGFKVRFVEDCVGQEAIDLGKEIKQGEIVLLENLRFYPEEEGKVKDKDGNSVKVDKQLIADFRNKLTSLADIYVNDAFGTMHRAHSSIVGINVPIRAAGFLVDKELKFFGQAIENPKRPLVVVLGGAKVADKLPVIRNLLNLADDIIIGGGMAFTFLKELEGVNIGDSLYDAKSSETVKEVMKLAKEKGVRIHLPDDFVIGKDIKDQKNSGEKTKQDGIPEGFKGFDIGKNSVKKFNEVLNNASTIIMNGPMGAFENPAFVSGSEAIVNTIADKSTKGAISIIGGGDSVSLVSQVKGATEKISHISTGGGASLELLEGKKMPGIEFLTDIDQL